MLAQTKMLSGIFGALFVLGIGAAGGMSASFHLGLHVSVEADTGEDVGLTPDVRVVGIVDHVCETGTASSQTV